MKQSKDPSVTYLNSFGYNVVKLPRVGIEPMDVIGSDDANQWLGPLSLVWTSTDPVPTPGAPMPAVQVVGQKTDQLELGFGLKILANALAAFGATMPSLDIAYKRARKVQFSFANVTSSAVAPFAAGNYLTKGTLKTDNPVVRHYFLDDEADAYLITDVLKSASITVSATDDNGVEVGVDVPAIQGVVGAKVSVKTENAASSTLTFTGPVPVTFGFIVDQILYDGKTWSLRGVKPGSGHAFALATPAPGAPAARADTAAPILLGRGCRVRI
jgi:hypothetical protein